MKNTFKTLFNQIKAIRNKLLVGVNFNLVLVY